MKAKEFEKEYSQLDELLGTYFASDADTEQFNEDITLSEYLYSKEMLPEAKLALKQAEEVLQLEPFPEELIGDMTNIASRVETRKEWLEKVVEKLKAKIEEMERKKNKEK
ncbi:hypothetical protein NF27_CL00030 [Candidatus Jidaibacter acanthamoeba]|uniref:Uncharacterized protein n=1 Tax=Candidatus Jidaibacter acanthamoebae TaxID=86105 RepID=A0A0C1QJX1_9RICK|nr:hypothetical protein [Candidatus Jidaibacter acanthamoeba]KIE05804.1 hypothetical protein NF27_CL00030 [Candidatus Jidaibacter acanthamoeba]